MKSIKGIASALGIAAALAASGVQAVSLQDSLSGALGQLGQTQSNTSSATTSASTTATAGSALTGLLNGNNQTLSSGTMSNATGVLQYCMQQKLVSATNAENVKTQLMNKLGLTGTQEQEQQTDYTQGLAGILNTSNGQQINLDSLKNTPVAKKARTKACDIILKQGKNFIN
ncbi:YjjA family protein [Zymobacter palmae]|uniref:Alcohol dehydrogenase, class IV n=1 Tax=Zymobacter palmae TaxID=33074 RepID=A0A348HCW5_9GAMM|nr:DUF2501 domain-containing protein [Zymobacter palmae]BBG29467.1 alcohol dehydrogenase, class IV [Zymobacter palmae]